VRPFLRWFVLLALVGGWTPAASPVLGSSDSWDTVSVEIEREFLRRPEDGLVLLERALEDYGNGLGGPAFVRVQRILVVYFEGRREPRRFQAILSRLFENRPRTSVEQIAGSFRGCDLYSLAEEARTAYLNVESAEIVVNQVLEIGERTAYSVRLFNAAGLEVTGYGGYSMVSNDTSVVAKRASSFLGKAPGRAEVRAISGGAIKATIEVRVLSPPEVSLLPDTVRIPAGGTASVEISATRSLDGLRLDVSIEPADAATVVARRATDMPDRQVLTVRGEREGAAVLRVRARGAISDTLGDEALARVFVRPPPPGAVLPSLATLTTVALVTVATREQLRALDLHRQAGSLTGRSFEDRRNAWMSAQTSATVAWVATGLSAGLTTYVWLRFTRGGSGAAPPTGGPEPGLAVGEDAVYLSLGVSLP